MKRGIIVARDCFEKVVIKIEKQKAEKLQKLLDEVSLDFKKLGIVKDSVAEIFTARFSDGFEADIKICSGTDNFFIDPVLFNNRGCEICALDTETELIEEYYFDGDDEKQYCVSVKIE